MLTIVPNEDGEMVAVPIHVQDENDDDGTKMEVHMDADDNADSEVWLHLDVALFTTQLTSFYLF